MGINQPWHIKLKSDKATQYEDKVSESWEKESETTAVPTSLRFYEHLIL